LITDIKAQIEQVTPTIGTEGNMAYPQQSKIGQLFTASWKQRLLLAGKLWKVSVGTVAAGGDVTAIVGGGNGTTVDQDQPEVIIGVPSGYFLIPVEINVAARIDADADGEMGYIIAYADRTLAPVEDGTVTVETPLNLLDGAGAFPGYAASAATADITDPTVSELLDIVTVQASDFIPAATAAAGAAALTVGLKMAYHPEVPSLLAGPCGIYVHWGGTGAANGLATIIVGCVPSSWFPTS